MSAMNILTAKSLFLITIFFGTMEDLLVRPKRKEKLIQQKAM